MDLKNVSKFFKIGKGSKFAVECGLIDIIFKIKFFSPKLSFFCKKESEHF